MKFKPQQNKNKKYTLRSKHRIVDKLFLEIDSSVDI